MDTAVGEPQARESESQIAITFRTKLPAALRVPPSSVTVPGNLTRYGLSQIINHLLALEPPRPFDFLIQDELLRLSLHKHMAAKQLSTEAVLEVEYVPAVLPPTPKEEHPHDDWVSALTVLPSGYKESPVIAAGCYDGVVRLWNNGETTSNFAAHKGAIKCTSVVPNSNQLITSGDDCVSRVWQWFGKTSPSSSSPELLAVLKGQTASVQAVAANPTGDRCITAGWDGQVLLFRAGAALNRAVEEEQEEGGEGKQKKKRRTGTAAKTDSVSTGGHEEQALTSLSGHTQCVSALTWPSQSTLVSASWDHAVRVYDPEVSAVLDTFSHNKAVHCVATPQSGDASLIAFGGPEKSLRVWDRRAGNGSEALAVKALSSHTDWISALAWHPTSQHHVLSVSYDKTAKLWDVRATVPLHTLPAADEKLLSCVWVNSKEVAYGGADSVLRTANVDLGYGGGGGAAE